MHDHPTSTFLEQLEERIYSARDAGFVRGYRAANKRAIPYVAGIVVVSLIAGVAIGLLLAAP